jgi:hypothetical protein
VHSARKREEAALAQMAAGHAARLKAEQHVEELRRELAKTQLDLAQALKVQVLPEHTADSAPKSKAQSTQCATHNTKDTRHALHHQNNHVNNNKAPAWLLRGCIPRSQSSQLTENQARVAPEQVLTAAAPTAEKASSLSQTGFTGVSSKSGSFGTSESGATGTLLEGTGAPGPNRGTAAPRAATTRAMQQGEGCCDILTTPPNTDVVVCVLRVLCIVDCARCIHALFCASYASASLTRFPWPMDSVASELTKKNAKLITSVKCNQGTFSH